MDDWNHIALLEGTTCVSNKGSLYFQATLSHRHWLGDLEVHGLFREPCGSQYGCERTRHICQWSSSWYDLGGAVGQKLWANCATKGVSSWAWRLCTWLSLCQCQWQTHQRTFHSLLIYLGGQRAFSVEYKTWQSHSDGETTARQMSSCRRKYL